MSKTKTKTKAAKKVAPKKAAAKKAAPAKTQAKATTKVAKPSSAKTEKKTAEKAERAKAAANKPPRVSTAHADVFAAGAKHTLDVEITKDAIAQARELATRLGLSFPMAIDKLIRTGVARLGALAKYNDSDAPGSPKSQKAAGAKPAPKPAPKPAAPPADDEDDDED